LSAAGFIRPWLKAGVASASANATAISRNMSSPG
jgi:hypothetical protein